MFKEHFAISQPVDRGTHTHAHTMLVPYTFGAQLICLSCTSQIPHTSLYNQRGKETARALVRRSCQNGPKGAKQTTAVRASVCLCLSCVCAKTLSFHAINIRPVAIYTHLKHRTARSACPYGNHAATHNHLSYHQR